MPPEAISWPVEVQHDRELQTSSVALCKHFILNPPNSLVIGHGFFQRWSFGPIYLMLFASVMHTAPANKTKTELIWENVLQKVQIPPE